MKNGSFSYAKARKMFMELDYQDSGDWWPEKVTPAMVVTKLMLAGGGFSGPPFFLGPNAKAELVKFTEPELEDFSRAVRDMLWEGNHDDVEELIRVAPEIALEFFFDVNKKIGQDAIDAVGLNPVSLHEIQDGLPPVRYLVEDVLVAGQLAVIGGPAKSMKTLISLDLMLSLAFKKKFLGLFRVPENVNVGLFSGESGLPVIRDAIQRIARAKGISLEEIDDDAGFVLLDDKLPSLDDPEHLRALQELILEYELDVVIIDPVYLSLNVGMASTNLIAMGGKLRAVIKLMQDLGCTLILNHHFTKKNDVGKPELHHLSLAGLQESMRQWILIGRRKRYSPSKDAGRHALRLNIGGSAGHSFEVDLDIDEGPPPAPKFGEDNAQSPHPDKSDLKESSPPESGRKWDVKVRHPEEVKSSSQKKKIRGNGSETGAPSVGELKRVVEVLKKNREGDTKSAIRNAAGLSTGRFDAVIQKLLKDGTIVECKIKRANNQSYPGYRLAQNNGQET